MPRARMDFVDARSSAPTSALGLRISIDNTPKSHAIAGKALKYGAFGTEIESLNGRPVRGTLVMRSLPGLDFVWASQSPIRSARTVAPDADNIYFTVATAPRVSVQFGSEHSLAAGEALAVASTGLGSVISPSPCRQFALFVPRECLGPVLRQKGASFLQSVPRGSVALQLLVSYLGILKDAEIPAALQQSVAAHVHDLLAVTLGATQDGLELAKTRGIRAARLHAIKVDVIKNLLNNLSIAALAGRHRVTPRYVQMLFEDEGTTFTEFVREERLSRARAMLVSPRFDDRRISDIAYHVGFGDLSYFNRAFIRHYGMSPGNVREGKIGK